MRTRSSGLRRGDRLHRSRARSTTTRSVIGEKVPDKLPMPLEVHRRAGEPCPRCGTTIEAIHFKDYVMCYCPEEQTGDGCSRTAGCLDC